MADNDNQLVDDVLDNDDLLKELAKTVVSAWEKKASWKNIWGNRKTEVTDVEKGIRSLISSGLIDAAKLVGEAAAPAQVKAVMTGIRVFQDLADLQAKDGIFGRATQKAMRDKVFRGCNERGSRGTPLKEDSLARRQNEIFGDPDRLVIMFCYIDPTVSDYFDEQLGPGNTVDYLANAFDLWIEHIDLSVKFTDEVEDANIVVTKMALDGRSGGTLADATIGGPSVLQQLSLRIDEEENFRDEDKFTAVMAHEIGHLFGLRHHRTSGHLMSPFYNRDILTPTQVDINRMRALWA